MYFRAINARYQGDKKRMKKLFYPTTEETIFDLMRLRRELNRISDFFHAPAPYRYEVTLFDDLQDPLTRAIFALIGLPEDNSAEMLGEEGCFCTDYWADLLNECMEAEATEDDFRKFIIKARKELQECLTERERRAASAARKTKGGPRGKARNPKPAPSPRPV
jgi:hypothetical protein